MTQADAARGTDLRLPLLALGAWAGALVASSGPTATMASWAVAALALGPLGLLAWRRAGARPWAVTSLGVVLVFSGVAGVARWQADAVRHGAVAQLARERAVVTLIGRVAADPVRVTGRFGQQVLVRVAVGRHQPVLVFGDGSWAGLTSGEQVRFSGRLAPGGDDVAATASPRGPPESIAPAGWASRAAARLRAAIRDAVAQRPPAQAALVPALVDGDDAAMPEALTEDFRTTGLTHLTAVSGTNLTLVVGFLLVLARWSGVRGRWLGAVGVAGIAGFVLLARGEPSVLRAAAMGAVALAGLGRGGWHRGVRGLGAAVVGLLLLDPDLATSPGFALSVLATGGILLVAPTWRDSLARWLPRWLAEAVAVPAAAQLVCTPLVAALSGQVSIVAVVANLVVAPVVGPATVLGLLAGLVALVSLPVGQLVGTPAGWCVGWIVEVAQRGAALPGAAVDWDEGPLHLALLVALCAGVVATAPALLRRRGFGLAAALALLVVGLHGPPSPGWPPRGWLFAACDVGQGDALVLRAGPGSAVVVDSGPEPRVVDACLRRLGVDRVPLLVLTHFHADHVDGVSGVLSGRDVGEIDVTRLADPPGGVAEAEQAAAGIGLDPVVADYGSVRTVGDVTLQVVWPTPDSPTTGPGDGSTANEASVVLVAEVAGVRILLTGDIEPVGQAALARTFPGLHVDVLKVPHHGSRYQDLGWLTSVGARYAVVSVGADNDYGHPAAETLDGLRSAGMEVLRTDRVGDVVVALRDGRLVALTRR